MIDAGGVYYLQLQEEALQLKRNRFDLFLLGAIEAPPVKSIAEFRGHVQRLN